MNEAQFIPASKKDVCYIRVLMFGVQSQLVVTNRAYRFHTCTTLTDLIHIQFFNIISRSSFKLKGGWVLDGIWSGVVGYISHL